MCLLLTVGGLSAEEKFEKIIGVINEKFERKMGKIIW
tara:strand:+ start:1029 stop:1139 length:111 start_codon:yes stop_codon:yes gene_type:complete